MRINRQEYELKRNINVLKIKLKKTDYQAIKYAEGEMSASEYAPMKEQCKLWRAEINSLEVKLKALKG